MGYSNTEKQRIEVMNETLEQITARATAEAESIYPYTGTLSHNVMQERLITAYQNGVIAEATRDKWISVDDRSPEPEDYVLWCKYPVVEPPVVASELDDDFMVGYYTHWAHLDNGPTPPSK